VNGQAKLDEKQVYAASLLIEPRGAPAPKY
jgi:hypothetical protein